MIGYALSMDDAAQAVLGAQKRGSVMARDGYWDDDHFSVALAEPPTRECVNESHPHMSRRCQRGEHGTCLDTWSNYPDQYGSCLCSCHGERDDDCHY